MGALPLSILCWFCRSAFTEILLFLFIALTLAVGITGLIYLLNGMILRQAERQLAIEAAQTRMQAVRSEPACFDCFRAACYAWCWSA